jgi:two-component system chemotaxis response regulator CheB
MDGVPEQLRVLIVSASPYTRYVVSGELSSSRDVFVVGSARGVGELAQKRALLRPEAAVVDVDSPADVAELREVLSLAALPVLVLSSHSTSGADLAFAAIEAGAADIVARSNGGVGEVFFAPNLLNRVRGLARVRPLPGRFRWSEFKPRVQATPFPFSDHDRLVVVSGSTGSLAPLIQLLAELSPNLNATLLILSPLPACYVRSFVRRMGPLAGFTLKQARDGMHLDRGAAFVAPCGYALAVQPGGVLEAQRRSFGEEKPRVVDATLNALASQYGSAVLSVTLSGSGTDGVQGAISLCDAGGAVIVQDATNCIADENPRAMIDSGAAVQVLPVNCITHEIARWVG